MGLCGRFSVWSELVKLKWTEDLLERLYAGDSSVIPLMRWLTEYKALTGELWLVVLERISSWNGIDTIEILHWKSFVKIFRKLNLAKNPQLQGGALNGNLNTQPDDSHTAQCKQREFNRVAFNRVAFSWITRCCGIMASGICRSSLDTGD